MRSNAEELMNSSTKTERDVSAIGFPISNCRLVNAQSSSYILDRQTQAKSAFSKRISNRYNTIGIWGLGDTQNVLAL